MNHDVVSAKNACILLKAWAQENNLLSNEIPVQGNSLLQQDENAFDSLCISSTGEAILRRLTLVDIFFNEAEKKVIVLTAKKISQAELKALPKIIFEEIKYEFIHAATASAGTATNATEPLKMQSGPVTATPAAGTFEYDGVTIFNTPQAGNRGVVPSVHYITQVSAYTTPTGTANTLKQMFNVSTNGALTVLGNTTYFFDCLFYVTTMSATSGTLQFGIGGTATFTNILYTAIANKTAVAVQTASSHTLGIAKTATIITAANTTTTGYARIQGKFVVSTGGTIIPSYATSIAAASIVQPGSYFKCWEAGNNTEVEIGAWT